MEYKIVSNTLIKRDDFEVIVNNMLAKFWKLHGDLQVVYDPDLEDFVLFQALIREV